MNYNFKIYKLCEIGEIVAGGTPKTSISEYWDGDIAWITPKDLSNYNQRYISNGERSITKEGLKNSSAKLMPRNSILFTSRAPIGYIAIANNDISTNQGFKSIICSEDKCHYLFLYYWLKNNVEMIISRSNGSTFQEVSGSVMKNIDINLPEMKIQKKIAFILNSIDDKIEVTNKINENLQSISQLLFKHWFVDFEFPNEEGLPYKSSGGEMIDSELGMIPKKWEVKTINDITYNFDSKRKPLSSRQREERKGIYPYYGAASIIDFVDNYIFDGIYILLGEDGTVINNDGTPVLQYIWKKSWINNHAHVLQGKSISTELLYLYLKQLNLSNIVTGAVQLKINQTNLNSVKIILANQNVINQFEELIQSLFAEIRNLADENENLINLRDTLLPKLMSGEIDVSNIEINQ